ncbi:Protein arginine N-methyltransferase 1 [Smittium culicis]|uniref:type I protein arginine methyltransferase n=1 Tax=Smittium culicis TaxID=133412 RepID=A0A1R1YHD2_9FUNG|nr:Protein arginine N-methyltransferase 1 [Smittium culicis]
MTASALSTESANFADDSFFKQDSYLKPFLENDPVIFDLDDLDLSVSESENQQHQIINNAASDSIAQQTSSESTVSTLNSQISALQAQLANLSSQFSDYREFVKNSFPISSASPPPTSSLTASSNSQPDNNAPKSDYYFDSYSYNEIHLEMIKDSVRTDAYRDFIINNSHFFKDKVVLDVGCGTGILSMFAAKAGAKKVFAVDNSEIIKKAKENITENNLQDVIFPIQGKIEDIQLPVDHVDIIISEWMGYFLLFESMLDSVLVARDRFLNPESGIMGPNRSSIYLTGIEDYEYVNGYVDFWDNVYGFSMTSMKQGLKSDAIVGVVPGSTVVMDEFKLVSFDHYTCTPKTLDFNVPFTLSVTKNRSCKIHAFLGYFDVDFTVNRSSQDADSNDVSFSTGPECTPTHWKQTMFLLDSPIDACYGDTVVGIFDCKKSSSNPRELDVTIEYALIPADYTSTTTDADLAALMSSLNVSVTAQPQGPINSNGTKDQKYPPSSNSKEFIRSTIFAKFPTKSQLFLVK